MASEGTGTAIVVVTTVQVVVVALVEEAAPGVATFLTVASRLQCTRLAAASASCLLGGGTRIGTL